MLHRETEIDSTRLARSDSPLFQGWSRCTIWAHESALSTISLSQIVFSVPCARHSVTDHIGLLVSCD
eukprot:scaffold80752_cov31-Tisochrysis_lutea.AAC.3